MKRDNWFPSYQGENCLRIRLTRIQHFVKQDFENAHVLDIGCNEGDMCRYAVEQGANSVVGIDYDTPSD